MKTKTKGKIKFKLFNFKYEHSSFPLKGKLTIAFRKWRMLFNMQAFSKENSSVHYSCSVEINVFFQINIWWRIQ